MIHVLPLLVKDLMCRDAVTIGSQYTVRQVARIMVDFKIDALMVIEEDEIKLHSFFGQIYDRSVELFMDDFSLIFCATTC